jgi:DNA-directed RNA polymerase subunit RPC12/RpoP
MYSAEVNQNPHNPLNCNDRFSIFHEDAMEENDKIIVLKSFDNPIDASLAKSKLDAYGIPCFLSEENLGNLYPVHNPRFSGVRLHLFEHDVEQARQVLYDTVPLTAEERMRCPRCGSAQIDVDFSRKSLPKILSFIASLFLVIFPLKRVNRCRECGLEF